MELEEAKAVIANFLTTEVVIGNLWVPLEIIGKKERRAMQRLISDDVVLKSLDDDSVTNVVKRRTDG